MRFFCIFILLKNAYLFGGMISTFNNFQLRPKINMNSITIQGDSLKTWTYLKKVDRLEIFLNAEGRPFDAKVELWEGPDNTPFKLRTFSENGYERPFLTIIETKNPQNTVCIKNEHDIAFPVKVSISSNSLYKPNNNFISTEKKIQGGSLKTYKIDSCMNRVQVLLTTCGRPINSRIEILQGPNNNKQIVEIYSENGYYRPFFAIFETPGSGNIINIINTSPIEFPMFANVVNI